MEMHPVKFKRFRPGWALTAVLAALAVIFLFLGNWQRERAAGPDGD